MNTQFADIGHNNPPSPFEDIETKINDLYDEAKQWLDGEPVDSQGQADALNTLINMIRDAEKEADTLRKDEAAPHDEAKAEIQARFNVLIGKTKSVKGKTVLALGAAKAALTPWLEKLDAEKREAERVAREEAEEARRLAQAAMALSEPEDLASREQAEALVGKAKTADITARLATKDKAHANGGTGRATGLRSYYTAEINDKTTFARWLWTNRKSEMDGFLSEMAGKIVSQNHDQDIPGVTIHEERKAV